MGGTAGEQVQHTLTLQGCEAADQIAFTLMPGAQMALEAVGQVFGGDLAVVGCLLQQAEAGLNPGREALLQGAIRQQRQQGGGHPHGQLGCLLRIGCCCLQGLQQWQVALDQCLEEPVLFQGVRFLCPHIGKVCVQNKSECPGCHVPVPSVV